jgi:hypothetical protein
LHDLYHRGWDYITGLEPQSTESSYNRGIFKTPKNLQMISFIPRIMGRIFHHKVRSFFFNEKWSIGYKMSSNNPELVFNWEGMHLFQPPKDRFYADPFPIKIKDKYYIFFEEYFFKTKKGVISFVEYLEDGKLTQPKVVLEKKYHLSYPFLFVFEDEIYLLPDTYYNQTVELYKSERFPFQWKKVKVLLANLKATDPTLFFYKNKFWLFTNIEVFGGNELDELFLFYSDSLDGEWIQHPQNPIVSDIRKARPAGKIFKRQGKIIRPSQDCSATYGYRINFNEITYLDEKTYSEKPVQQIAPTWLKKGIGCHTYNEEEGLEVVDGKVMALKTLPIFLSDLRRKK